MSSAVSSMASGKGWAPGWAGNSNSVVGQFGNALTGGVDPATQGMWNMMEPGASPDAPGVNPNLAKVQQAQVGAYNQFTKNIPTMQNQMGNQARQGFNQQAGAQIQRNRSTNSGRGLLYGGINQGQEAGIHGQAATKSANAQGSINAGLLNTQSQLQGNAVNTGLSIQQNQQQIQDDIYQQAIAQMQASSGMFGSAMGSIGKVGGLLAAA